MEGLSASFSQWLDQLICQKQARLPLGLEQGDAVHVWSDPKSRWHEDGVVKQGTTVDLVVNGARVPAGSLKVEFDHGSGVRWIPPSDARKLLRKVPRPHARSTSEAEMAPGSSDVLRDLRTIQQSCRQAGRPWTDVTFKISVGGRVSAVLRPSQIARHDGQSLGDVVDLSLFGVALPPPAEPRADWTLFRGRPLADDVQQGELGDCWFLSSLAALADFQEGRFVRALLPGQDRLSSTGVYVVRLCLGGRWRGVAVDDHFPCLGGGRYYTQLAYCVTKRQQLWASIIEKGFAKACGSYEAIRGGEASEALEMLTGWPCSMMIFERPDFDPEMLWAALCSSRDAAFLMTCSTKSVKSRSLESDHVYSLMDVHEVMDAGGDLVRLLKIRNPHAKSKWQGDWSDASTLWTPHLRRQLDCPEGGNPQVFFMAFRDFLQEFAHCTICRIRSSEWHEAREPVLISSTAVNGLEVEASEMTECSISLVQPGERLRGGPLFPNLAAPLACLGFVLLRQGTGQAQEQRTEVIAAAPLSNSATVSADCWLPPGKYLLVPLCWHRGSPLAATWAFVSSKRVTLKERSLDTGAVQAAWTAYSEERDPHGIKFHGVTLRFGKADGGAVVAVVENPTDKHLRVQLGFKSDCLRFSRGSPEVTDWLAPGFGQILQVAQPKGPEISSVTWSETHTFRMTNQSPPEATLHTPPMKVEGASLHSPFRLWEPKPESSCLTQ